MVEEGISAGGDLQATSPAASAIASDGVSTQDEKSATSIKPKKKTTGAKARGKMLLQLQLVGRKDDNVQ